LARLAGLAATGDGSFTALSDAKWRETFAFAKPPGDLSWADRLLASAGDGKKDGNAANLADMYIAALEKGFAAGHYLLLTCDSVDKRQRFFSFIKKNALALAVDCSVAAGTGSAAKNEQEAVLRDVVAGRLALFGKKIEPGALQLLFARAGFHPTAVAIEVEKLALYAGEREKISRADVELLTGRTREDALFELTDALAMGDKSRVVTTLAHLQYGGVHALAILATLRNFLRKLLVFKALQERNDPPWTSGMNPQRFQNDYLPALKEKGQSADQLQGHPYALFKNFSTAARSTIPALREHLESVLEAEYQMKGSELPSGIVLEEMLVRMMKKMAG
jgi:DNA polymerase-3 subunit delta